MGNPLVILIYMTLIKLLITGAEGDILASSKLDVCVVNSFDKQEINCSKKMIIALTIVNGKSGESDMLETYVTGVDDKQGQRRRLETPYRIGIRKSDVYYNYPLIYIQQFNSRPFEEAFVSVNCVDDKGEEKTSCGWLKNKDGSKVADSQGFCCRCNRQEGLPKWLGGKKNAKRFPVKCDWFTRVFRKKNNGSAHCLRFDNRWFAGFRIIENSIRFTITVIITEMNATSGVMFTVGFLSEPVIVSPETPVAVSYKKNVKVKLQGDFVAYSSVPMINDRFLALPLNQGSMEVDPRIYEWMLLEKYRFTLDGRECNKVGVSFSAFKYQYGACVQDPQSCLANQLSDFIGEDRQLKTMGRKPLYSVTLYGAVNTEREDGFDMKKLRLNIKADTTLTSVITLDLVADGIRYYVNRSPGRIMLVSIQDFEAMSRNGVLYIEVKNIGELTADFTLTVSNCSTGIELPDAKQISLPVPAAVASYQFLLHSIDDKAKNRTCSVNLLDAVGALTDAKNVSFSTTSTKYDNKSQDFAGDPEKHKNESDGWDFGIGWFDNLDLFGWLKLKGCDDCKLPNIMCFIWNFCWSELISSVSGIITIILVGIGVYLLWSSGLLMPTLKALCIPCKLCCLVARSALKTSTPSRSRRDSGYDNYSDE